MQREIGRNFGRFILYYNFFPIIFFYGCTEKGILMFQKILLSKKFRRKSQKGNRFFAKKNSPCSSRKIHRMRSDSGAQNYNFLIFISHMGQKNGVGLVLYWKYFGFDFITKKIWGFGSFIKWRPVITSPVIAQDRLHIKQKLIPGLLTYCVLFRLQRTLVVMSIFSGPRGSVLADFHCIV